MLRRQPDPASTAAGDTPRAAPNAHFNSLLARRDRLLDDWSALHDSLREAIDNSPENIRNGIISGSNMAP